MCHKTARHGFTHVMIKGAGVTLYYMFVYRQRETKEKTEASVNDRVACPVT